MKSTRLMLGIWVAAFLLAAAAPARAQSTVDDCKAQLAIIQADLDDINSDGGIGGNNPLQTSLSLSSKLDAAAVKLDQHKYADALGKLRDFRNAVIAMRDAPRPASDAPQGRGRSRRQSQPRRPTRRPRGGPGTRTAG